MTGEAMYALGQRMLGLIAAQFQQLSSHQMAAIEAKVAGYPGEAAFFKEGAAGFGLPDGADDQQMEG